MAEGFHPEGPDESSFVRGQIDTLAGMSSYLDSEGNPVRVLSLTAEPQIGLVIREFGSGDAYKIASFERLDKERGGEGQYRVKFVRVQK